MILPRKFTIIVIIIIEIKKNFANVRRDIIKNKRLTDIELDTIEARVTLANLMGFDDDPLEAHEEQPPPPRRKNNNNEVKV